MASSERDAAVSPTPDPAPVPPPDPPSLPVAVVARRLGVAPATLRTWARRYDLGPSEHAAGSHRRYTTEDLARLEAMRRLTMSGVSPAEAAQVALRSPQSESRTQPEPDQRRRGGPGGRVLALPGADAVVRGLGRAAMALDSAAVMATLRSQIGQHGVSATWEHVLRPVLAAAGERWANTGEGVEVEHLLSDCVTAALREITEQRSCAQPDRPVLLAGAPGEQHSLPLHAVAAALAELGVCSRVLGPAMPVTALVAAVRRTGASALFLWSQLPGTASAALVGSLPTTRPPTALIVGGPGWDHSDIPARVRIARDLDDAVELVRQAAGA